MTINHNDLHDMQGGQHVRTANEDTVNDYFHLTSAEHTACQTLGGGIATGRFNVTLGVTSIVENAACADTSNVFLMADSPDGAGLATAIDFNVAPGTGFFTATHGSAEATGGRFMYLIVNP